MPVENMEALAAKLAQSYDGSTAATAEQGVDRTSSAEVVLKRLAFTLLYPTIHTSMPTLIQLLREASSYDDSLFDLTTLTTTEILEFGKAVRSAYEARKQAHQAQV